MDAGEVAEDGDSRHVLTVEGEDGGGEGGHVSAGVAVSDFSAAAVAPCAIPSSCPSATAPGPASSPVIFLPFLLSSLSFLLVSSLCLRLSQMHLISLQSVMLQVVGRRDLGQQCRHHFDDIRDGHPADFVAHLLEREVVGKHAVASPGGGGERVAILLNEGLNVVKVADVDNLGLGWRGKLVSLLVVGGASSGGVGLVKDWDAVVGRNSTVAGPPGAGGVVIGVRGRRRNTPRNPGMVGGDYGSCGASRRSGGR